VKSMLDQLAAHRGGALVILMLAALLEAGGDSYFQSGLYRTAGAARVLSFGGGAAMLVLYGLFVNLPRWDFGRLLGIYVVLFFLTAQVLAKVRFQQSPTPPILLGGSLIVVGGLIITFWKG
jgi:drug/metabolite transporter superfamily protein YnfA